VTGGRVEREEKRREKEKRGKIKGWRKKLMETAK